MQDASKLEEALLGVKPPVPPRRSESFIEHVAKSAKKRIAPFNAAFFSTEATVGTRLTYVLLLIVGLTYTTISFLAPLLVALHPSCDPETHPAKGREHLNPDYEFDPCWRVPRLSLLGMSPWDADMNVRVVMSLACGSLIGFERRRADRAAGIRTMALVCLGACVFTIASSFAFIAGPMAWDASRVSAAIPSGVGFLGAASIWKGTRPADPNDSTSTAVPEVHGLTTATSVWLSSAVGILVGGQLYAPAIFSTAISIVYLRFAPRLRGRDDSKAGAAAEAPKEGLPPSPLKRPSRTPARAAAARGAPTAAPDLVSVKQPLVHPTALAEPDSAGSTSAEASPNTTPSATRRPDGTEIPMCNSQTTLHM